ncbi:MAG: succinate dehydrogenase, hydrophobic membrane anchor protein [Thiohalomonadaceae bacterium]
MNQHLSGLPAWLVQRLSAVYLALFVLLALLWWWLARPNDYAAWHALFASLPVSIAVGMFVLALLLHAWVGMRNILLDYLGYRPGLRLVMLSLLGASLLAMGVWALRILTGVWTGVLA